MCRFLFRYPLILCTTNINRIEMEENKLEQRSRGREREDEEKDAKKREQGRKSRETRKSQKQRQE